MATVVTLQRDGLNTAWGFRLQGGSDLKVPLSVQRVFVGSPADGELHRGDTIVGIDNLDAAQLTHKQAEDRIKNAGSQISLRIQRSAISYNNSAPTSTAKTVTQPQGYRSRPFDAASAPPAKKMNEMGINYFRGRPANQGRDYDSRTMLRQLSHSLNDAAYQQSSRSFEVDGYEPRQVARDLRGRHSAPRLPSGYTEPHTSYSLGYHKRWTRPEPSTTGSVPSGLREPGWAPGTKCNPKDENARGHHVPKGYVPSEESYNPSYDHAGQPTKYTQSQFSQPAGRRVHTTSVYAPDTSKTPAWKGTLRPSGGPKPWEVRDAESLVPGSTGGGGGGAFHRPEPSRPEVSRSYQGPSEVHPHQPRVQTMHYAPGQAPQYQQHNPATPQAEDSDAKVVHLQYNSPLGLYSRDNVKAALVGQTVGKPGEGTLTVTGDGRQTDPRHSAVAQLVHERDHTRQPVQRTYSNPGSAQRQASNQGVPFYGDYAAPPGPPLVYGNYNNSASTAYGLSDF